ncbi:MAG: hypothetical protein ACLT40_01545 [Fusobacterium sp.]
MANQKTMVPGFLLTIEDNATPVVETPSIRDVYTIYCIMPELMKAVDSEGEVEEVYCEPNKPLIISDPNEAIQTLEQSDLVLTREIKNIIKLIPNGATIALVRIVTRDGENPNPNSMTEMYEALDFAFSQTENFPSKEIIVAGMSLDKSVSLNPNVSETLQVEDSRIDLKEIPINILNIDGNDKLAAAKKIDFSIVVERVEESASEKEGIYNKFALKVNDSNAMIIEKDGNKECTATAVMSYSGDEGQKVPSVESVSSSADEYLGIKYEASKGLILEIKKDMKLVVDDSCVLLIPTSEIVLKDPKPATQDANLIEVSTIIKKVEGSADILTRIMKHNAVITSTQNNCLTFLSPEPPKNSSNKAIGEYVDRCEALYTKVRDRLPQSSNGRKFDLGMYLSVPVGVNMYDGLGGLEGFPQSKIAALDANKVTTKKVTSNFEEGDIVEVYTHKKLDILTHRTKVVSVSPSKIETTEITLEDPIPEEISTALTPKYIMLANNKDYNGTYLARQYSNICEQAGVDRSPAGITFPGECQIRFSDAQEKKLDAMKFCTLQQEYGKIQGAVSRSQLMTGTESQFQNYESLRAVYELVDGCKTVVMPYKGQRIDDGTDLALIKTELEDTVFKPAVGVFITSAYDLKLKLGMIQNPNGQKERTLYVDFGFVEIQTLKLIRMTARIL